MTIHHKSEEISLFSFAKELQGYSLESLRSDTLAAISVALLTVPQAMAYALLAGLPISCGIFAAIYASLVAAFFGSSRHLIVGPSNAIAILVQAGTAEFLYTYYRDINPAERSFMAVQILTQLTLMVSFFQILAAGFKLGRLTQFVSHSVVIGYISGTAIAVVINQLYTFLGIPRLQGVDSIYDRGLYLLTHLNLLHFPTAFIGVSCVALILGLRRMNKSIPAALVALISAGLFVHVIEIAPLGSLFSIFDSYPNQSFNNVMLVQDAGVLSEIVPVVQLPLIDLRDMNALLPLAFAIALLSIMETTSVAKSLAASTGQRLFINQEILGIGLGNFVSSLIGGLPISGNPGRSNVNYHSGALTRVSAVLNVTFVMLILLIFGAFLKLIPLAALAGLLLITVSNLVNSRQFLLCLKATQSDALVLVVTILSCIFFSFDSAFYIGVVISITSYLKKSSIPQLVEFEIDESGELKNIEYCSIHNHKSIRLIKVEGELFFGAADIFQSTLKNLAEDDTHTKVIILQLKNARDIDATVCLALQQLHDYLTGSNRHLILCGITQQTWDVINDSGLLYQFGKDNLFVFDERQPHHYLLKSLRRARELAETVNQAPEKLVVAETVITSA